MPNLEKCHLGIELGSTRIKAVLIDESHEPVALGSFAWENIKENGVFIYHLEDAVKGLRACYADLRDKYEDKFGEKIKKVGGIGISGMMHGYLVLDKDGNQIAPFRTWRNTITEEAALFLTDYFKFNIPQRWSIAHLYQAILNGEEHLPKVSKLITLSIYIQSILTGEYATGIDEASGMFPLNDSGDDFDRERISMFDELIADKNFDWKLGDILPKAYPAGSVAGYLTPEGAALLDDSGNLESGIPFCPPEGDGGTGMVATGAVLPRTGSISAGTSSFSMQVLEAPLKGYYTIIDVFATPTGKPVAMAHCNNCTPEIDAWVKLFSEFGKYVGCETDLGELYGKLYSVAMEGEPDCGGMVSFNYTAGEPISDTAEGRPMFIRMPEAKLSLPNFMRAQLYGAIATLIMGIDFLHEKENVVSDKILGLGGYFKTQGTGAQVFADALNVPITVTETAGEGGPWGMALLAAYMNEKEDGESLEDYLTNKIFSSAKTTVCEPDPDGVAGFAKYLERYKEALDAQRMASKMK